MATPPNNVAQQGRQIAVALGEHAQDVARSVEGRLQRMVQQGADEMRRRAPKDESTLTDAIKYTRVAELHFRIDAGVGYAPAVEYGRKPGKGLPHLDSPQAGGVLGWLRRRQADHLRSFVGPVSRSMKRSMTLRPKKGSKLDLARQAGLRDRYMGLSRAIKAHGLRAQPFFTPVAERLERDAPQLLAEEVQACMARAAQLARGQRGGVVGSTA